MSYSPGVEAFSQHAVVFFSTAASICQEPRGFADFKVYAALFGIRHGLELCLKTFILAERVDRVWVAARQANSNFESIARTAGLTNAEKKALRKALCVLRNIVQDNKEWPAFVNTRMESLWVERAIDLIRDENRVTRLQLERVWAPSDLRHDIGALWRDAQRRLQSTHGDATYRASVAGLAQPMSMKNLGAVCELIAAIDPEGGAFRYPATADGTWRREQLTLSVDELGNLARELEATARAFSTLHE